VSAVDAEGRERQPYFDRLLQLVKECDDRGLIVDVTLARHAAERVEDARGLLPNAAAHRKAVETLTKGLKPFRNWYLDLANERDVGDERFVAPAELRELRAFVREMDPGRLVTASFGGHDLGEEDLRDALETIGVDFLCPHRPRHAESPAETEAATRRTLEQMRAMDKVVPVHYQEPFRRGYTGWEPSAEDFLTDLRGARQGGAAGWCFHNGSERGAPDEQPRRSFDLETRRLMEQLDAEELRFLDSLRG
jgi:hypothetical protein